jgi:hypothetical protein
MLITQDLSNEQLIDLQLASDQQHLQPELGALADWARAAANRPEDFWRQEQAQIRQRIAVSQSPLRNRLLRLAWATASALALAAAFLLGSAPEPKPPQAQVDPDQELLLEVERLVQSNGPEALEPAALVIQETSQNVSVGSTSSIPEKEMSREN